jgi:hypothetical protein
MPAATLSLTWSRKPPSTGISLRHRPVRRADRPAIDALRGSALTSIDPTAHPRPAADGHGRVVLRDDQIIGWLAWQPRPAIDGQLLPLEPWAELDGPLWPDTAGTDLSGDISTLRITGMGWHSMPSTQQFLTTQLPIELCQLHGYAQTLHLVEPASWSDCDDQLSPAAFVQQIHSGPLTDPIVSPMLASGWRLDGWLRSANSSPLLLVRWLNPVHR